MKDSKSTNAAREVSKEVGLGAKVGVSIGFSAWWVVFALLTIPYTGTFAWAILGAAVLSSFLAWLVIRRLQNPPDLRRLFGWVLGCAGLMLAYHSLAIQPLFDDQPAVEDRLRALGSVTRVPWGLGAVVAGIGVLVLGWRRR